ncbi:hypothetical protein BV22DRAFT_1038102, partial [Leucogyrophana mollusca]
MKGSRTENIRRRFQKVRWKPSERYKGHPCLVAIPSVPQPSAVQLVSATSNDTNMIFSRIFALVSFAIVAVAAACDEGGDGVCCAQTGKVGLCGSWSDTALTLHTSRMKWELHMARGASPFLKMTLVPI